MALLSVNSLDMGFGEDDLFLNMSFEIQPGDRIGLIGVNGSGKTTLFKLLVGDYKPNKGTISLGKGTTIGHMEQHVCRNLDRSAYNEVVSVFSHLSDIEMELDTLNAQISAGIGDTNKLVEDKQCFTMSLPEMAVLHIEVGQGLLCLDLVLMIAV